MNTNRFESRKSQSVMGRHAPSAGPAWWGAAVVATFVFVLAIWFLTRSAG
jgi:hypothetical protein